MIRRIAATPALLFSAVLCLSLLAGSQGVEAQVKPEPLAENANWRAHSYVRDGTKVCYMHSKPAKSKGNYKRRGAPQRHGDSAAGQQNDRGGERDFRLSLS